MADLPITSDEGGTPIVINDPTTTANVANVKGASTAAVVGDNSLVVALSPNSSVPTGTNKIGVTGVSQGSTTSGQNGDLVQGAVTTSAPTYVTGQTDPLSLTTTGSLRVNNNDSLLSQGSTTSGELGSLILGAVTTSAPTYVTAQTSPLSLTTSGDLRTVAKLQDGSGNSITSTANNGDQALDVSLSMSSDGLAAFDNTVFTTSYSFSLPTSGTESLAVYLKNPNASGKTLVIKRIHVAPITATNAMAEIKVYSNPTTSANGTSQTATTTSIGSGAAAVATPFSGPTASANGAQLLGFSVSSAADGGVNNHFNIDGLIRIAANNTLLVTGTPTSNSFNMVWTVIWQEV